MMGYLQEGGSHRGRFAQALEQGEGPCDGTACTGGSQLGATINNYLPKILAVGSLRAGGVFWRLPVYPVGGSLFAACPRACALLLLWLLAGQALAVHLCTSLGGRAAVCSKPSPPLLSFLPARTIALLCNALTSICICLSLSLALLPAAWRLASYTALLIADAPSSGVILECHLRLLPWYWTYSGSWLTRVVPPLLCVSSAL
jgi:hypothetical protein